MALGDPYATVADLTAYLFKQNQSQATSLYGDDLADALDTASRDIELHCHRQFNQASTPTARVYEPATMKKCYVDDFYTTDGMILETDTGGIGDFSQLWDPTMDVEMFPSNGVVAGQTGWPFNELRACRGLYFPKYAPNPYRRKAIVRVTASWGWAAVPAPIHQACLILAADIWKRRDAPFGVAGMQQFGVTKAAKGGGNAQQAACDKMEKYVLHPVQVG